MKNFFPLAPALVLPALVLIALMLSACQSPLTTTSAPDTKPTLNLKSASFDDLPAWREDNMQDVAEAFTRSCARIIKANPNTAFGALKAAGTHQDWQKPCRAFLALKTPSASDLYQFFETHFTPHAVLADNKAEGLFTGYYEASLKGSRTRSAQYNIPLHARADDLVMVQLGEFREDLKGRRIAGRVVNGKLKPYESRSEIVSGDYPHNDDVIVWVDSAVDAFFVQIQGSGIVRLDDGGIMRIGYAGQNGHPYYAIGRELIKRGALTKETVSMQSIRAWLETNPSQADEIMNTNASYVFFTQLNGEGPLGGEGVALTPERSLAIDRSLLSYGMPIWTDIAPPVKGEQNIQKLMITQDTGGAIRGPVRGDVFWGYGTRAESLAGAMKSKGRYWVLLPK